MRLLLLLGFMLIALSFVEPIPSKRVEDEEEIDDLMEDLDDDISDDQEEIAAEEERDEDNDPEFELENQDENDVHNDPRRRYKLVRRCGKPCVYLRFGYQKHKLCGKRICIYRKIRTYSLKNKIRSGLRKIKNYFG